MAVEAVPRDTGLLPPSTPSGALPGWLFALAAALLALLLAALLAVFSYPGRNLLAPVIVFAGILAVPLILRRPVLGVYLLMAGAVIIEEGALPFGTRITDRIPLFTDINGIVGIRGLYLNPAEALIMITALGWLIKAGWDGRLRLKPIPFFLPFTVFMAVIALGVIHGGLTGGDLKVSLWTVRPLAYLYLAYILTTQLLENKRQVTILIWLFIIGVALKGAIGWWRYYVDLGANLGGLADVTGGNSLMAHEESFFFVGLIILALVQLVFDAPKGQKRAALLAVPVVVLPFFANQRRAGSLALLIGLPVLAIMAYALLPQRRRAITIALIIAAVVLPIYGAVYWNKTGLVGEPVRAVKSGFQPEQRDLLSNEYRDAENNNLQYTVKTSPLIGIGFGKEMIERWPMPDISAKFAWYKMAPHNSVLWLMMTIGIPGFILFWYWAGRNVVNLCLAARRAVTRADMVLPVFSVLMLLALLVMGFLDQGLLSMRAMMFVGVLLGATFSLPRLRGENDAATPSEGGADA